MLVDKEIRRKFVVESLAPELGPNVFLTHEEATGKPALLKVKSHETAPKEGDLLWAHAQRRRFKDQPDMLSITSGWWKVVPLGSSWLGPQHCVSCNTLLVQERFGPYCPRCEQKPFDPWVLRRLPEVVEDPKEKLRADRKRLLERILQKYPNQEYAVAQYYEVGDFRARSFSLFATREEAIVATKAKLEERFLNNYTESWQSKRLPVTYVASLLPTDPKGMQLHEYTKEPSFARLGAVRNHFKIYMVPREKIPSFFGINYKPKKK